MFAHQAVATDFVFIFGLFTVFGCAFGAFLTVNYTLNFLINKAESCTEDDQNMIGELTLIFSTLAFLTNSIIVVSPETFSSTPCYFSHISVFLYFIKSGCNHDAELLQPTLIKIFRVCPVLMSKIFPLI